ncbi:cell wall-binding repeat-containing protein [Clostridium magnum]|uniref:N-acetylmuramoyl-L-alanine amidase LytC n=1 Tax=Clostridium magnum DSM 2767 TaxID=1121326 RepID=A0A162R7X8_9CLOT|nr:cell wall-binding repeat-containing protein [Clostridium magnum]KZL89554.1 N-acetylmuramoyl-L-alanine amidase LytC precursor [Clostridium magnum DSM 2767]SHH72266.1 N-acetylmuramoyl-L-alanine amidase [Clostridium magnum DSM 2767]
MFSRKNVLLIICAFFVAMFATTLKVSAAPAVERIGGSDRYETAIKISQSYWTESDYVVIVSGENFPDALCAAPLAQKYRAPILLTESSNMRSNVLSEVVRLNAKNAFIVGGTAVISEQIENELKNKGLKVIRKQGKNRYETSIEVAKEIGTSNGAVIASGENFPDALSIASIAASKQMPIILTVPNKLLDVTKQFIDDNNSSKYYVIGGNGAVEDSVVSVLNDYKRLSGRDRYETNTAIINEFLDTINIGTVFVADGNGFADALSGSAAASKCNSPIVLVHNDNGSQQRIIKDHIVSVSVVKVLGGTGVVPDYVVQRVIYGGTVITLDAGHGGYDSGAVGPSGLYEKNVNLDVTLKLGKILEQKGIDVVYTRTSDEVSWPANVGEDLQARCDISDAAGSNYFVSIHANSSVSSGARGIETYYYSANSEGKQLAQSIQTELINETGLIDRGVLTANFYVIKNTAAPSVLVEVGFISNPTEEALLGNGEFQDKLAEAIAQGIMNTVNK